MKKQIIISLAIFFFLILGTVLIVLYGRGYRLGFEQGKPDLSKTGLLVATSIPNGAEVHINDHLTTATDNTLSLSPGEYKVKIVKEGYFPWEKTLTIKEEVVTKADALLFPTTPKLENITTSGVSNPVLDPSGTKIAYTVTGQTTRRNGIYVFDMNANTLLSLQSAVRQIADDTQVPLSTATLSWSPDADELLASVSGELQQGASHYLLSTREVNQTPQDVTLLLASVREEWARDKAEKDRARLNGLKPRLRGFITQNTRLLSWSYDENKVLYVASQSAEMPLIINPRLVGINDRRETRSITQGSLYVYDSKEDVNIKLQDTTPEECLIIEVECQIPISWFPDSKHLIAVRDQKISVMDYDGTNETTLYAGPFMGTDVFPWPNGSKLVILTNFNNTSIAPNLYTIGLK